MTTTATVVAMIPLLMAAGAGAASRFAIGVVIAGGMTIGTLFTLFVTPAVYTFVSRDRHKAEVDAAAVEAVPPASRPPEPEPEAAAPAEASAPSVQAVAVPAVASEGGLSSEARAFSSAAAATTSRRKRKQKAAKRQSARSRRFSRAAE